MNLRIIAIGLMMTLRAESAHGVVISSANKIIVVDSEGGEVGEALSITSAEGTGPRTAVVPILINGSVNLITVILNDYPALANSQSSFRDFDYYSPSGAIHYESTDCTGQGYTNLVSAPPYPPIDIDRRRNLLFAIDWPNAPIKTIRPRSTTSFANARCVSETGLQFGAAPVAAVIPLNDLVKPPFHLASKVCANGAASGLSINFDQCDGCTILIPTPTPTPTPTPRTTPIVSPTSSIGCAGDCNGDGAVTIDELVQAVGIATGTVTPDACREIDADGDETITVADLVRAVNAALSGC